MGSISTVASSIIVVSVAVFLSGWKMVHGEKDFVYE